MMPKSYFKDIILNFKLATQNEICLELGRRLRLQRLAKHFKQEELAQRAGVSIGTVKNLEAKGHTSLETLIRVATALDLLHELQEIFTLTPHSIAQMEQIEKLKSSKIPQRVRTKK